jgi:hypothetical protein
MASWFTDRPDPSKPAVELANSFLLSFISSVLACLFRLRPISRAGKHKIVYGEKLRGCNPRNLNPQKAQGLSPELQAALEPLLAGIESLSEQIRESNERIEHLARTSYPEVALLKQV